MPARLVYAPKAYVFTKNSSGTVLNFTDYVVSGRVQRLISQPSTATVSLRNPQKRFTIPKSPTFHPMDPITIFLERLHGYPVQVFTGYLDDTPYYQMYPGVITLQATCTLKRLLYSFWDPSLPYVNAFLNKWGWINDNGNLRNVPALSSQSTVAQGQTGTLQDGGIGKLLWASLTDIGDWHDSNIWIEQLPSGPNGIAARMAKLMATLATDQANAAQEFEAFMHTIIGSNSYGTGGGNSGAPGTPGVGLGSGGGLTVEGQPITKQQLDVVNIALGEGVKLNAPKNAMIACIYAGMGETALGANPQTYSGTGGAQGVWQAQPGDYNNGQDIQGMANGFYTGGKDFQAGGAIACANRGDAPWMIANEVEANAVWISSHGDSYANRWPGGTSEGIAEATNIVNAYLNAQNKTSSSGANLTTGNNPRGTTVVQSGSASGNTAPTGATGSISNSYVSPFPGGSNGATIIANQRTDQGVDWDLGPVGSNIVAIGNAQVLGTSEPGWPGPGGFMWYQLLDGPNQGAIIYYAEGIQPSVGTGKVSKGQPIATVADQSSGVEFGYCTAAGQTLYQNQYGAYSDSIGATDPGRRFARFMRALGVQTRDDPGQGPYAPTGSTAIVGGNQPGGSSGGGSGSGGTSSSTSDILSQSNAQAFTAELNFPSVQDMTTAMILGNAHKGLMHDQQLLPFIQQLSQASLRQFQSLPNGDFFAFYPDYFGETNHRKAYWNIADIEVLDGGINLNDGSLVTHQFAVGDNTYPVDNALINSLFSAGTITVFNAFLSPDALGIDTTTIKGGMADVMSQAEAVEFVKRYGARPQVSNYPMVRSALYEMFLAYQQFMLSWANQFRTPFSLTFMPEVFPGGKVAFPEHGLQMYVNAVTHSWDYAEAGFTTDAVLSAPSVIPGSTNPDLPPNMVQALVEPVRQAALLNPQTSQPVHKSAQTAAQEITGVVKSTAQGVAQSVDQTIQRILGAF